MFDAATLRAAPIRDDAEYDGLRVEFDARLGNSRVAMQIDIGFGNAIEPPAVDVEFPTLLGQTAPRIRAYPQEAVVAEKLHAMVQHGELNSRMKDFYDMHVLASQFAFDGTRLTRAIAATFERRRTAIDAEIPVALTSRFYEDAVRAAMWRAYLTRNALPGAPAAFEVCGLLLQKFLGQPWRALGAARPFAHSWSPTGIWTSPR